MSLGTLLLVALAAVIVCILIYIATGGHMVFLALPLLFGLPLISRRRR